jgi:hypothetical protein
MNIEERDLVGCCGLYCGLCTKFQSRAKSRCLGCKLGEQHSWVPAMDNLCQIAEIGVESWLEEQRERRALVEALLQNYNEGRSMTFFCKACTRMPVAVIDEAIEESKKRIMDENIEESDIRSKAKVVKEIVRELASASGVDLT